MDSAGDREDGLIHLNLLMHERLIRLIGARELEGISVVRLSARDPRDDVGTGDPVCFSEIGRRPLCGMVGVGVVKADDIFTFLTTLALEPPETRDDVLGRFWADRKAAPGAFKPE